MDEKIQEGDIVMLKSGSPHMTVTALRHEGDGEVRVWVAWFDDQKKAQAGHYNMKALEKIS